MLMLLVMGMKASSERERKNEKPPSRVTSSLGPMGQINRVLLNWRERPVLSCLFQQHDNVAMLESSRSSVISSLVDYIKEHGTVRSGVCMV